MYLVADLPLILPPFARGSDALRIADEAAEALCADLDAKTPPAPAGYGWSTVVSEEPAEGGMRIQARRTLEALSRPADAGE